MLVCDQMCLQELKRCYTHSFASKVDLYQWIHQVLTVTVKPKNLLHAIHEGIIHCRQTNKDIKNFLSLMQMTKQYTLRTDFVAGLQLCRSSA